MDEETQNPAHRVKLSLSLSPASVAFARTVADRMQEPLSRAFDLLISVAQLTLTEVEEHQEKAIEGRGAAP